MISDIKQKHSITILTFIFVFGLTTSGLGEVVVPSKDAGGGITPTPEPYTEYLVLIGENEFDPDPENFRIEDDPLQLPLFRSGKHFQKEIMGWSDQKIANERAKAKDWFDTRFGIDVDDASGIEFFAFMADPRWEYTVYTWSGHNVPSEGYNVRDGGWAVMITDPQGYDLGGQLDGVHVQAGAIAVYGKYNILTTNPAGNNKQPVIIHYRSNTFMEGNEVGNLYVDCQVSRDNFEDGAEGLAQGLGNLQFDSSGNVQFKAKNVITFDE